MKKLSSYIGRYWYGYVFAVASMVTAIALDMLYPKITQKIVDDVILGGQMEILTKLLTGIVLVGIGRSIFGYCKEFTFDFLSSKIGAEMRKDLFNHIQTLSMRYFDDTNTGELMARVKDDVDKIQNALGYVGMLLIEVTIHVVFVLYCMFSLNWKMAFLPVTVMLCCAVVAIIMERKLDKVYEDISEENAVLTTVAEENLAGVRTVKAFAREDYEIKKFLNEGTKVAEIKVKNATKDTQTLNLIANASLSTTFQSNFDTTSLIPSIEIKENISAPIAKDAILGKISYNIDGIIYEADLIAENDVIKSNFIETLLQILLAIIVLILIAEFFSHKRKKQKNNKKNLRKNSSVYKFNLE